MHPDATSPRYEGFAIGQRIRALDHKPRVGQGDCYIEGPITQVYLTGSLERPYAHYVIAIERDVSLGADVANDHTRVGATGYVPIKTTFDYHGRVTAI